MPRIRTIKPEFVQSESMGRVSREARLLFILLWTISDDYGKSRANSRMLASTLYPYDEGVAKLILRWLDELEQQGCIFCYEVNGDHYLQIVNWHKHQRIDHPGKPLFPDPREDSRELARPSRTLAPDQGPRTRDQGSGIKDQGGDFVAFWSAYPHKVGKGDALKAFKKAITKTTIETLLAGIERYRRDKPADHNWCNPATWLNQERWLDEPGLPATNGNGRAAHGPATGIMKGFADALAERDNDCRADFAPAQPLLDRQ